MFDMQPSKLFPPNFIAVFDSCEFDDLGESTYFDSSSTIRCTLKKVNENKHDI